jgi:hypothetical protein
MTQDEFIKDLDRIGYSYEIEGDKIIVTHKRTVFLSALTSLPPGVVFKNGGDVHLNSLTSLPPGVEFRNKEDVELASLTSLSPGVVLKNGGDVNLDALIDGWGWFFEWKGNIKGIKSTRLLNSMISKGMLI